MKFGPVSLDSAEGAVLAHSVALNGKERLRKGCILETHLLQKLRAAGIDEVIAAVLEEGDVIENTAAQELADALVPDPEAQHLKLSQAFTGRVNVLARGPGVAVLDVASVEAVNRVHPMITLATVQPYQQMRDSGMVATIKIISYAVPRAALEEAIRLARKALKLAPPVLKDACLIVTETTGGAGEKGVPAIRKRVEAFGATMSEVRKVPHRTEELAAALRASASDVTMILTGSATSDPDDVAPLALRMAGGQVQRFGMPVDPGNLLFTGTLDDRPVIGLPGCARSPSLNGADWVMSRILCGIPVSNDDIAGMGVGGLLKEIPTRPQPRRSNRNP